MSHVRDQIRAALSTAIAGLTTTSSRVYTSRAYPVTAAEMPCWVVTGAGGVERISTAELAWPHKQLREYELALHGLAQGTAIESTCDTMLAELEVALSTSSSRATLGGLLLHPLRIDSVEFEIDGEGEKPTGRIVARLLATYETVAGTPGTAL